VPPEERVTSHCLQRPEAAYIIAIRAEQIAKHPTAFTDIAGLHDPVAIAFKELFERRCPLTLRRPVGLGPAGERLVEEWNVREMTLPSLTPPVPLGGMAAAGGARARP
jgi:DNA-directed RNA polymerase subunit K/omega